MKLESLEVRDKNSNKFYENAVDAYIAMIKREPLLSVEEERDLFVRVAQGDSSAVKTIARRNMHVVLSVAKRCQRRGCDLEDLLALGVEGLYKAIREYDLSQKTRFSTFANRPVFWEISNYIQRQRRKTRPFCCTPSELVKYNETYRWLEQNLGRTPSAKELSEALEWSFNRILNIQKSLYAQLISLDAQIPGDTATYGELVSENHTYLHFNYGTFKAMENIVDDNLLKEVVNDLITTAEKEKILTTKELTVLKLRLGFGCRVHTEPELAKFMQVTHQNIHKLYTKALRKLRLMKKAELLAYWSDNPTSSLQKLNQLREIDAEKHKSKKLRA